MIQYNNIVQCNTIQNKSSKGIAGGACLGKRPRPLLTKNLTQLDCIADYPSAPAADITMDINPCMSKAPSKVESIVISACLE